MSDPVELARAAGAEAASCPSRLLRLSAADNVLIVIGHIGTGEPFQVEGVDCVADRDLPMGFKVAADDLPVQTVVLRLGIPIGCTTAPVRRGAMVHTHNLESQYLRTHARGEA